MYLVVGGVEDVLAREVFQQAGSAKLCSEADLLESCITGNLDVDGERVPVERRVMQFFGMNDENETT